MTTAELDFARRMDRMNRLTQRLWPGRARRRLVGGLTGDVLDVGSGAGANLPFFTAARRVVALEPGAAMRAYLRANADSCPVPVLAVGGRAEALPFGDDSFDAVVCALVLCSVPDLPRGLAEIRRVLRPGGRLLYFEHVRAKGWWGRVQDRLDPRWGARAEGCHINRDTGAAIDAAGFEPGRRERMRPLLNTWLAAPFIHGEVRKARGGAGD